MRAFALSICLVLAIAALPTRAADDVERTRVSLRSRTFHLPMEAMPLHAGPAFPFYQWLEFSVEAPASGLSMHSSLWGVGALDGSDRFTGERISGDIPLLYVQYADRDGRFTTRLGRQLIFAGPGVGFFNQMDGAWARGATGPFDLQLYAGQQVQPRFENITHYDWLAGGRAGFHRWGFVSGGVSFLHARNDGALSRELAGADLTMVLSPSVDLAFAAAYDLVDPGFQEARAIARWNPIRRLTLSSALEYASPSRFIDKSSIFSVFAFGDFAQAEMRTDWALNDQWIAGVRYARVFFPSEAGVGFGLQANRFGGRVTGMPLRQLRVVAEADRMPSPDNAFTSFRLACRYLPDAPWSAAADMMAFFYDHAPLSDPRAGTESVVGRVFGDRHIGRGMHLGLGAELGRTVLSAGDLRGFVRLTSNMDMGMGGRP